MLLFNQERSIDISRCLLGIFLFTTALNRFTQADAVYYAKQLDILSIEPIGWLAPGIGILQLLAVIALVFPNKKGATSILFIYALASLFPVLMMFTHPVWIESMGGFPAIGAGQGLIKYVAIVGVTAFIASHYADLPRLKDLSLTVACFGVILVMGWIGGMKFTQYEADGIQPLLSGSPLFSWIYDYFNVLHGSYFIGVIEMIAVVGLAVGLRVRLGYLAGLLSGGVTFLATQTFLITYDPAITVESGFPLLSSGGQFIIKDIILLATCVLLFTHRFGPTISHARGHVKLSVA
ncbi:YkgB family protein [Vibrio sp.]|nr:YkgB family protein [Vibrio sp.]